MAADIEKAFLMVSMAEKDRDVLRFMWVDDITKEELEIIALSFTRVVFGVSSSPFLLNATIQHNLKQYSAKFPETVKLHRSTLMTLLMVLIQKTLHTTCTVSQNPC